jgi:hypothetical protein
MKTQDWIEFDGLESNMPAFLEDDQVEVQLRGGGVCGPVGQPWALSGWHHWGSDRDIVRYRVV